MGTTIVASADMVASLREWLGAEADVMAPGEPLPAEPWVLWLDGLSQDELGRLEKRLLEAEDRPIAVLGARWDGFTAIPLAHLCRGVISGFGIEGVRAAMGTLQRERKTAES